MKKDVFSRQVTALGLKVEGGVVSYNEHKYGVITGDTLVRSRERNISLDTVDGLSFTEGDNEIHLYTSDGEIILSPTVLRSTDIEAGDSDVDAEVRLIPTDYKAMCDEFPYLFPDWNKDFYYDELNEKIMVNPKVIGAVGGDEFEPISEYLVSEYHYAVLDKLSVNYTGKGKPSNVMMDEALVRMAGRNRRNPFREWVESLEWDGKPRLRTLFQDVFGGTAPALTPEEEVLYLGDVAQAWILGAIYRMYRPFQLDIVPVFMSGQGAGKTRALQFIAARDEWYTSTSVDVTAPGGVEKFLDAVRGKIVVELGEATQIRTKDADKLKEFITKPTDQMRKAYAHQDESFPRHFIMAATSNIFDLFTDVTGNRRFFPIVCDPLKQVVVFSIEDRSVGGDYIEQIYAEAYHLYKMGVKARISDKAVKLAAKMQDFNSKENSSVTVIDDWLDESLNGYAEIGSKITKNQIIKYVFDVTPQDLKYKEYSSQFDTWANGTKNWKKCKAFRIPGDKSRKTQRGYERILAPGEEKVTNTFNMVTGQDDPEYSIVLARSELRRLRREYHLEEGMHLPNDIPRGTVDALIDAGFVVDMGTPSCPEYVLMVVE